MLDARELRALYEDVERPLVGVLARDGGPSASALDREFLDEMRADLQKQCDELESKIHAHAGEPFVVNSVPQLRRVLFEVLELTPVKRTKTGPSTDADSLQKMAATSEHPILADLLKYREVEKLRSTYADALPPLDPGRRPHPRDVQPDRDHHRPHLEREPEPAEHPGAHRRGPRDAQGVRRPTTGCGLLTADYSQIELRDPRAPRRGSRV